MTCVRIVRLALAAVAMAGCAKGPTDSTNDFASSVVVQGMVRDSLGVPLHAASVTAVGYASDACSGFMWSSDSTATDSTGHYYCRISNFGRPQSVKATATAPAGHALAPGTSCHTDLDLAPPAWRDTLVIDFTLGGA